MRCSLFCSEESFVDEIDLIEKISALGMEHLYVRKPRMDERALGRFLLALPESVREKTFLYGFPSAAQEFGLAGILQPLEWILQNEKAVWNSGVSLGILLHSIEDLPKLSAEISARVSAFLLSEKTGNAGENGFVLCDATEIPAGVRNAAIVSGIWEFADPVSAWKRLCLK